MSYTEQGLKQKSITGVFWKFSERFAAKLVSLVVSIVLARLLTPSDYSVVGIVSIFFVFANVFISGGFNTALIQKKDVDIEDYSSVLCLSMFIALVAYGILFVTAPFIAGMYEQKILVPVIRVMGITLLINAWKSVLCAYISKNLQFKKFFMATIGGTVLSAVVGIIMAWYGMGPWALVAQQMVNSIVDTLILTITTKIKFVFSVSLRRLQVLFNYGWKIFVSSIISVIYDEINPLIIGLKYSGADLAFYSKGRSFPYLINTTLGDTFSAVLFPVMAKVQDNKEQMLNYTRRFMGVSSFIVFPAMIGFFAVSDNFITVILTDKWLPAGFYIRVFCFVFMLNIIQKGNLEVIKASGRSDLLLIMEIIKKSLFFVVIGGFLLFSNSPEMLAVACMVNTLIATIVNTFPNRKIIGYRYYMQILDLLPNLLISMLMGVVVWFTGYFTLQKTLLLLLQIVVGMITYLVLNLIIKNPNLMFYFTAIKEFVSKRRGK